MISPWRQIAAVFVFTFGGIILIHLAGLPGNFEKPTGRLNALIFAWMAAFYTPHQHRIANFWLLLIAIYYALYLDEGVAFGALMLLGMAFLIWRLRDVFAQQSLVITTVVLVGIYMLITLARNTLMVILFVPVAAFTEILWRGVIFAVGFVVFSSLSAILLRRGRVNSRFVQ